MTTETAPEVDTTAPPAWPPVQHIVHKKDLPVREGSIALCGAKLMGLDLGRLRDAQGEVCSACLEEFKRLAAL